ncbi:hypothetical protein EVAR_73873_1, partial [Eumeta japonica]
MELTCFVSEELIAHLDLRKTGVLLNLLKFEGVCFRSLPGTLPLEITEDAR